MPSALANLDLFAMSMALLGGLAFFLFGMGQMGDGLKAVAGDKLKSILAKLTTNRVTAALTGALVTGLIQSSSITTVLVVGFITAGFMTTAQAIGVIFGANVGSTLTAQIIAFKVTDYALLLVATGFLMNFAGRRDAVRSSGSVVMGLGLVFYGMGVMSEAMAPLRTHQPFLDLMMRMESPLLGILVAAAFTALVQSSSATTGITIVMASQGLITLPAGIALIFGANIGTCGTALLATIGKPREALQASLAHVIFNVVGVLLWVGLIDQLAAVVTYLSPVAPGLEGLDKLGQETPRQIANAHTVFNVTNTVILLPFSHLFATLVARLAPIPPRPAAPPELAVEHLDPDLVSLPPVALEQVRKEILRAAAIVRTMLEDGFAAFLHADSERSADLSRREATLDFLERKITEYLAAIGHGEQTSDQSEANVTLLKVIAELDHVSDAVASTMVNLVVNKQQSGLVVTGADADALTDLFRRVLASYDLAIRAFETRDPELARTLPAGGPEIEGIERGLRRAQYLRLTKSSAAAIPSAHVYLDFVDALRRVHGHALSIGAVVAG